jgi:acyl-CoA reductase-like NAD-dependent aldehyde dehydrogenase
MSTTATFEKHDPTTGEVIAKYKDFTPDEVFATVASAKEASVDWQSLGFRGRKRVLLNWAALLTSRIKEIAN